MKHSFLHKLTSWLPRPFGEGAWGVGLLLLVSCADMLAPESDLVMTPEQNTLSTPNDTIYSVTGTITLMQKLVDRTNLLGEVRGDLVECTKDASKSLQNLAAYNLDEVGDLNRVADYYAVINNCNYFINTVDTTYAKRGQKIFIKEYAVMKTYRAWTYLQLALHYGRVPFYTDFLATAGEGQDVINGEHRDLKYICDWLIDDIAQFVETPLPDYGSIGSYKSSDMFIPVRLMLAELCLYSGRYRDAAQYYHDFLTHTDKPRPFNGYGISWIVETIGDLRRTNSSYSRCFSLGGSESIGLIPMEETEADGNISHLDDVYESTDDNYYYYQLTNSEALTQLSANQNYCYVYENTDLNQRDTIIVHPGDTTFQDRMMAGDLRLYGVMTKTHMMSSTTSQYSKEYQSMSKVNTEGMAFYRLTTVYLHFAEALNRAGFPSAAMLILKYGVCPEYIDQYVTKHERENAGSLLTFSQYAFLREDAVGIHSSGSGQAECDTTYVLPMPDHALATMQDTIEYQIPLVENMIMDEAALECCFEGTRFFDLQRIALRRGDAAYLADRVARRSGTLDAALHSRLMNKENWYLPLPE